MKKVLKYLKKLLVFVLILIGLILIVALFVKNDYSVVRQVTINKPAHEVYEFIRCLKNQDQYSVWSQMDPKMKKSYKGTDGEIGFVSSWDSKNEDVGKGSQKITKLVQDKRIETHLSFKVPFEAEDDAYFETINTSSNQTNVKWGFKGRFNYPMNIMQLFMDMDEMLGNDLDKGLKKLKKVLEK